MGFNTTNPIKNVFGTAIIVVIASLLAFLVLFVLKLAVEAGIPEINGPLKKLKGIIFWNTLIRFWVEEF